MLLFFKAKMTLELNEITNEAIPDEVNEHIERDTILYPMTQYLRLMQS